jgi:transposase
VGGHGDPEITGACQAFRGTLGTKVVICKPGDPEAKGSVERFHDYLERAFLPGRMFASPVDFNTQLHDWLVRANHRQHRVLGCRPADRIVADRAAMLALSPVGPSIGWRTSARLPRDHYVRLDGNDYSVHPVAVGRRIEVTADLQPVRVWCAGNLVADHDRVWANTRRSRTWPTSRRQAVAQQPLRRRWAARPRRGRTTPAGRLRPGART